MRSRAERTRRLSDARAWKIDRSGAPSPRAYLQFVGRITRAWKRQILRALGLDRTADAKDPKPKGPPTPAELLAEQERARDLARRLQLLRLVPPKPSEVEAVGAPAARQAMRTARRSVENAGVPRTEVALRLGLDASVVVGLDIAPTLAEQTALTSWAKTGTDLIVSVGQELVAGLDEHIQQAARAGTLTADLRQVVMDRLGVSERHAQFIARDQIAKLNGQITEATHKAAGITHYRWRSSRDQRTRPDHRALDGTTQAWADPPVVDERTGRREHPGGDYQCRCVAIPIVDDED